MLYRKNIIHPINESQSVARAYVMVKYLTVLQTDRAFEIVMTFFLTKKTVWQ